jgi:hypothetical protein
MHGEEAAAPVYSDMPGQRAKRLSRSYFHVFGSENVAAHGSALTSDAG